MTIFGHLRAFISRRLRWRARPRVVRRVTVHCPESGAPVEIDLLMRETGPPDVVLRCSAHPEQPPACDQACRRLAEAVLSPPAAVIICPPGSGLPEEID
jgi:hypothetical protein